MSICKTVFLAFFLAAVFYGSVAAGGANGPSSCDYRHFGLDGSKFFLYMTKDTPYTGWSLWPGQGKTSPARTPSPHGPLVTTYVNPAAQRSLGHKEGMAFGSLIVMENRSDDGKLTSLDARIKIKGYHPAGGDWYWFHFAPDGAISAEGKAASCLACHEQGRGNDFVMK
ncbi:MAG: cytochrome P460 family protein [Syntrophaceae bacterium]